MLLYSCIEQPFFKYKVTKLLVNLEENVFKTKWI